MKKTIVGIAASLCLVPVWAQDKVEIKMEALSDSVYVLYGRGGNIAASAGPDGLYVIDDQYEQLSEAILAKLATLDRGTPEFLINTHYHGDHTGGNENFAKAGAHILAHHNVHKRLHDKHGTGSKALPVLTYQDNMTLHFNGEHARVVHYPHAHTDGDSVIFFDRDNIVHMGDTFFNLGGLPYVDVDGGGDVEGLLAAIANVLSQIDTATKVIPGHGPVTDKAGLQAYFDRLSAARDLVRAAMQDGATEEQVVAAKPLSVMGIPFMGWLPEERVTALFYRSLSK